MLSIVPVTQAEAKEFIRLHHRHHRPSVGDVFRVGVAHRERGICGVAMVGRLVARALQDGWTLEVTRVATDGTPNACSMLYGAAWRAARALGYSRLVTYTLPQEGGASLRASNWSIVAETAGGGAMGLQISPSC